MKLLIAAVVVVAVCAGVASASMLPGRRHIGALNEVLRAQGVDVVSEALMAPEDDGALYFETQLVDHFDYLDGRQWSQKFYMDAQFWSGADAASGPGPVFLMLGGEGPISASYNGDHFNVINLAKKYGAMLISLEHRYYSANTTSMPTSDEDANLYLLTTEQALADIANFIVYCNAVHGTGSSKWITFGGSYSGALSLWARAKYPSLIAGAWGTSGPVEPKTDFFEYLQVVSTSVGPACSARIQAASQEISNLLATRTGRATVSSLFSTCTPVETSADAITFYSNIVGVISGVVQYNNDNNLYQPFNITTMCGMLNDGGDAMKAMAGMIAAANKFSGANCTDASYADYVAELKATGAGRSWMYQCCSAYGFWQAADSQAQPFNDTWLPLAFNTQTCKDVFGDYVPARPQNARVATNFGSLGYRADNAFAPNGDVDPWHALGIVNDNFGENSARVLIHGTAHCADLYPPRASDLPGLTAARAQGEALIQTWLQQ